MAFSATDPQQQRRGPEDARRSLARFMSEVLPQYNIFIAPQEPEGMRPSCVIRQLPGRSSAGSHHTVTVTQPYAIYAYPEIAETAREAESRAHEIEFEIEQAIEFGVAGISNHMRIPMWEWTGVAEGELIPTIQDVVIDYYRVEGFECRPLPDPDDARRWSIASTLRLVWSRHAGVSSGTPVTSVGAAPAEDGIT